VTPALSRFDGRSCKPAPFMHGFRMHINVGTAELVVLFFGDFPANFATNGMSPAEHTAHRKKAAQSGPPRFKEGEAG
jgi:hypothetical protein